MPATLPHPSTTELVDRILTEGPIGMHAAARLFGSFREGKPVHPSSITRWITQGVAVAAGHRVKLEGVRVAGRLVTSRAAVVRFLSEQQGDAGPVQIVTPAQRRKADAAAEAVLDRAGV